MYRKNFEAVTGFKSLKQNAIQVCGEEFIRSLTSRNIHAKDEQFWQEVNCRLNIADDAYTQKSESEKLERQRQEDEKKARENAEMENLLANKKKLYTKERGEWLITVFELPDSEIYGKKYIAEIVGKKNTINKLNDDNIAVVNPFNQYKSMSDSPQAACSRGYSLVDEYNKKIEKEKDFAIYYQALKPLYLMILYLSGDDYYNEYLSNSEELACKENFVGLEGWNGFDFNIIDKLERECLIQLSTTRKTLTMTKKAMKEARRILKDINLEEVKSLLKTKDYHEEYIDYKSHLDSE